MKNLLSNIYEKLPPFLRNKYILALALFIIWVLIFDNNNLIDRYHDLKSLKQLENDKEYYTNRIEEDKRKLNELRTDDENLEKFAREEYHMKKDDEDIFIIVTEKEEKEDRK
jgi:cell division protein DivIC